VRDTGPRFAAPPRPHPPAGRTDLDTGRYGQRDRELDGRDPRDRRFDGESFDSRGYDRGTPDRAELDGRGYDDGSYDDGKYDSDYDGRRDFDDRRDYDDSEYDDDEYDEYEDGYDADAEPDEEESPAREWLVVVTQLGMGALGGAGLWLGFQWLWRFMPVAAFVVALVVITALVWVVRRIRRADDLQTTVVTVLVGLFVTVSPAALLLLDR